MHESALPKQRHAFAASRYEATIREPREQIERSRGTGERFGRFHVRGNGVIHDFSEELLTEYDLVLQLAGQRVLCRMAGIPNPGFAHEIEAGAVDHCSAFTHCVRSEEDRCAEDSLKRSHEPPILGSTLLHAEGVQHLCRTAESNDSALLFDCQRREENRHQAILTPRKPVRWMTGDLKKKLPVPSLV
jgi:hypothetical protein